jgi:hypothetical protein
LLVFIRGVGKAFEITEELAALQTMKTTTTGDDIFSKVEETLSNVGFQWKNLKCVTTDGGRNMCGTKIGLVGDICKAVQQVGAQRPMILHCTIHQKALCGQSLQLSDVMNDVVTTVNFIRSHALAHRQLKTFCLKLKVNIGIFLTTVRFVGLVEVMC